MDAFNLVAKLTLDDSGLTTGLNAAENTGKFSAWGVTVGSLAARAFASTFTAGTKALRAIFETGMSFETMMSSVKAVANPTEEQFEKLNERAQELGASTKFTATEVSEAFYYMGLAGWDTEEMLEGIDGVLNLAAASGEDLGRVSDIVTDALTAMGYKASDTARFVDVLAAASTNSNTTVAMMGEAFKYLATTGGVLEYSIEDVATVLGLLANNGIKASQAGTSMRQILNTLINPSKDAAAAMEKLGISLFDPETNARKPLGQVVQELQQIFKDAGLQLEEGFDAGELQTRLDKLNEWYDEEYKKIEQMSSGKKKALKELDQQYNERFDEEITPNQSFLAKLGDIGGFRGISSLFALMKSTDEDTKQLTNAVNNSNGAAKTMADTMLDNLEGRVTILNSAIEGLKLAMYEDVNPAARSFVDTLTAGVTKVTNLIKYGKLDYTAEDRKNDAVQDAVANAAEAQGLVSYMDSLVQKYGEAATKSTKWADALERLNRLVPGLTDNVKAEGDALGVTTQKYREYIEQQKQKAIQDAKQAYVGDLQKQYNQAQVDLGKAQINAEIAGYEREEALRGMVESYLSNREQYRANMPVETWLDDELSGYTDAASLMAAIMGDNSGYKLQQLLNNARTYSATNGGDDQTDYEGLRQAYEKATSTYNDNTKKTADLTTSSAKLYTQLQLAENAVRRMTQNADALASAASGAAGALGASETPDGSHASGAWNIPYDNYRAVLHRGERVLTASQARRGTGTAFDSAELKRAVASAVASAVGNIQINLNGKAVASAISGDVSRNIYQDQLGRRYAPA